MTLHAVAVAEVIAALLVIEAGTWIARRTVERRRRRPRLRLVRADGVLDPPGGLRLRRAASAGATARFAWIVGAATAGALAGLATGSLGLCVALAGAGAAVAWIVRRPPAPLDEAPRQRDDRRAGP